MRRLTAVRLVNWYHFSEAIFRFSGSCLLLGDNGSGKSTVLDAVQFALVADQTQVKFNKAANEHSRRSLYNYVRYKLGSEDESRPGQQRYGRGGCTSYIMLQFDDDRDERAGFVAGVVMDATEADTSVAKAFFVIPRAAVEDVPAVVADHVQPIKQLRLAIRDLEGAQSWPDAGTYQDELRHRLGALPRAFHRLIVKAVDFRPIGQVRDFVLNYLLDHRPVDTAALQSNLEHYKRLEAQARDAEVRIGELDKICDTGAKIQQERRVAESHRYVVLRADAELATKHEEGLLLESAKAQKRVIEIQEELERVDALADGLGREKERVLRLLAANASFREIQILEKDRDDLQKQAADAKNAEGDARRLMREHSRLIERCTSEEARDVRRRRAALLAQEKLFGHEPDASAASGARAAVRPDGPFGGRDLEGWRKLVDGSTETLAVVLSRLKDEFDRLKEEGEDLERQRANLERGQLEYPLGAQALLHLLRGKLQGNSRPLCEVVEIRNDRWRDAVEGFLNTQRFNVLVDPADFPRALSLYDRNKRGYRLPGRGEVFISNVGLVDVEKLAATAPRAHPRSLALQIETDDAAARVYVDFLLGDVICVDDEQQLRLHRRSITDTVMVYSGHVARQVHRDVYAQHYLGQAAKARRMAQLAAKLQEMADEVGRYATDIDLVQGVRKVAVRVRDDVPHLRETLALAQSYDDVAQKLSSVLRQLAAVDRTEISALEIEKADLDRKIGDLVGKRQGLDREQSGLEGQEKLRGPELERARARTGLTTELLAKSVANQDDERRRALEEHYASARREREPADLFETFRTQQQRIETRVSNLAQELVSEKTKYANAHGFTATIMGEQFEEFEVERDLWRNSRLPEHRADIARAKEEAIQQLTEDIIFKLRANLLDVTRQIDDLNRALKDVPFGSERYQFTREVDPHHRRFYDLIMAAGQYEKDSLFGSSAMANTDTRETLEGLFDRLIQAEAKQVKTELEERADYREYFLYDLKIHHADGTHSLYDRVAADKSGGETQTPYYIAIFASMYRVYRSMAADGKPSCGLVLLDEAFSKMDEHRISATLAFARELGLQLLMATPKERSDLVAPRVETALFIHKDTASGVPVVLDFTKEFSSDADAQRRQEGDPDPATAGV